MAHIKYSSTRAEATPHEWLRTGAQLGDLVNTWAGRSDLVAYVGPGAGGPAPACYSPKLAEVEVNVDIAFGNISPELIGDLRERDVQFEWPRAAGAIFHEALHARYSRWNLDTAIAELPGKVFQALTLLEESRIEAWGVREVPSNRAFLRACALDIVLADIRENTDAQLDVWNAAHLAGLLHARIDAGVLEHEDVEEVVRVVDDFLGAELVANLRELWRTYQSHANHYNVESMYGLAYRWVELLQERAKETGESGTPGGSKADENGEPGESGEAGGSSGSGTDESGEGEGTGSGISMEDVLDALEDMREMVAIMSAEDIADQQTAEEWEREVKDRGTAAREMKEHQDTAARTFAKGTGPSASTTSKSRLAATRAPSGPERAAAVKVAQMLEKAKYRERDEVEIHSVLPPGRLRTRAMVQGAALKSKGIRAEVEPWRRTARKHTDDPTLNIGVMVDISGSMGSAMEPMAVTAWVMSEAARRIQARAAMVYYGSGVFPTLKPGQHLSEVHVYTAPDGTERFDEAFKVLDGGLNLLHGTGARLLVIVSDGCYTPQETRNASKWMKRLDAAGVAVLWLPFDSDYYAKEIIGTASAAIIPGYLDPAKAATEIGTAAARQLTNAGTRRAA